MDDEPDGASGDGAGAAHPAPVDADGGLADAEPDDSPASEIVDLPWDDDLPVAMGEETSPASDDQLALAGDDASATGGDEAGGERGERGDADGDDRHDGGDDDPDDPDELDDPDGGRRSPRRRRVDTWRSRTATGAIASAIAMGLQQVFEPERRLPAAVAEAPSDPYDDDDPITVDYVPDDAEATKVHVKPWLLQKGDPT